jgi:hypothetical protein
MPDRKRPDDAATPNGLDGLARFLAKPMPRRRAIRVIGGAIAGIVLGGSEAVGSAVASTRPPLAHYCHARVARNGWHYCIQETKYCFPGCCPAGYDCDVGPPGGLAGCPEYVACRCGGNRECGGKCCAEGTRCLDAKRRRCSKVCHSEVGDQDYDPRTECCTQRAGVQPKYPVENLLVCSPVQRKGAAAEVAMHGRKGCPSIGENAPRAFGKARFGGACDGHLQCYARCGADKASCDAAFHRALMQACASAYGPSTTSRDTCEGVALAYVDRAVYNGGFFGVVTGNRFFDDLQKVVCQCCADER